jgi:hypothetical protein
VFEYLTVAVIGIGYASQRLTVSGDLRPVQDGASCQESHLVSVDMLEHTIFRMDVGRQQLANELMNKTCILSL